MREFIFKLMMDRFPSVLNAYRELTNRMWFFKKPQKTPFGFWFNGRHDMETGEFEATEVKQLLARFQDVTEVVNVGANCGYYTCLARSLGKKVIAIEPLAPNLRLLLRNLMVNGWDDVEVVPMGISDRVGIAKIYGVSLQASLIPGWSRDDSGQHRLIPVTTMDVLLSDRLKGKKVIFVVDIEGAEHGMLKGATHQLDLQPRPVWFLEIHIDELQPKGVPTNPTLLATFDLFWEHGYTCQLLAETLVPVDRGQVVEWSQGKNIPRFHNFFFQ